MANIKDCPGFETFGADVKEARKVKQLSRKTLAEQIMREESAQRQRVSHKLKLCPEEFLPIIEGAIDGAIQIQQKNDETEGA